MSEELKGWSRPEEKFPEAELEDSFAEYFAEDNAPAPGKKQRRRAAEPEPDLLVETPSEDDPGFVIEGLAAIEPNAAAPENGETDAAAPESAGEDPPAAEEPSGPLEDPAAEPEEPREPAEPEAANAPEQPDTAAFAESPERAPSEEERLPEEPFAEEEPAPEESGQTDAAVKADAAAADMAAADEAAKPDTAVVTESSAKADAVSEKRAAAKSKTYEILKMTRNLLWNRRKHRWAAPVGLAVIVLAVIGFISVILGGFRLGGRVIDNTKEKEMFAWKIYPLMIFDPAAFDDPNQLDGVFLLKTALWKTLLENRMKYSYNDDGMLVVPVSDLNVAAKSLYGDTVKLNHQTFSEGYEYYYIYDESVSAYLVPVMGQTAEYAPEVVKISRTEGTYTLLVGYATPSTLWNMDTEGNLGETAPTKYMYYDLKKLGRDSYIITAVREVPADEVPEDANSGAQQQLNETRYGEILGNYNASANYTSVVEKYLSGESEAESAAAEESAVSAGEESSTEETEEESVK